MDKKIRWNTLIDNNVNLKKYIKLKNKKTLVKVKQVKKIEENIKKDDNYYISNITKIKSIDDYKNLNSLELLKNQEIISCYLSRYINQNTKIEKIMIISYLELLSSHSIILAERINQKIKPLKIKNNKQVTRSSYKFCCFNSQCEYNYGKKKKPCNSDHYVHSSIYMDIKSLLNYINNKKEVNTNEIENDRDITKCLNTVSYVVRHMCDELKNVCIYCKNKNYEKNHFNKKKS